MIQHVFIDFNLCSQQYERWHDCYRMVIQAEARRRRHYQYIIKMRPDSIFTEGWPRTSDAAWENLSTNVVYATGYWGAGATLKPVPFDQGLIVGRDAFGTLFRDLPIEAWACWADGDKYRRACDRAGFYRGDAAQGGVMCECFMLVALDEQGLRTTTIPWPTPIVH